MLVSCKPKTNHQQIPNHNHRERVLERRIHKNYGLFVTSQYKDGKELKGVKSLKTQKMIIDYGEYVDITIDKVIIKTENKKNQIFVYNHQGTLIGGMSFDSFVKINSENKEGYYIGTKYDKTYYYFHTSKKFFAPEQNFVTFNEICIVTKDKILFYNHDGEYLWQIDVNNTVLLQTTQKQSNNLYVIKKDDGDNYSMFNSSGIVTKTFNPNEWHSFLTKANKTKYEKFYYAEVDEL